MAAVDFYQMLINSQISLDDYCKFAGIAIGSDKYLELQNILNSRQVLQIVDKATSFNDLQSAIDNASRISQADSVVDALNDSLKSGSASSIIGEINKSTEGNINRIYSKSGDIIEFYVDTAEKTDDIAGAYSGGLTISEPLNATKDASGKIKLEVGAGVDSNGQTVRGILGTISSVFTAISVATWLGRTVSTTAYNASDTLFGYDMFIADPDFWSNLYAGDDSFIAMVHNAIWKVDPVNNELTMYIDDRYAAMIAGYLCKKGWFAFDDITYTLPPQSPVSVEGLRYPIQAFESAYTEFVQSYGTIFPETIVASKLKLNTATGKFLYVQHYLPGENNIEVKFIYVSKTVDYSLVTVEENTFKNSIIDAKETREYTCKYFADPIFSGTVDGSPVQCYLVVSMDTNNYMLDDDHPAYVDFPTYESKCVISISNDQSITNLNTETRQKIANAAYIALYGVSSDPLQIEGVGVQPNAKIFTTYKSDLTIPQVARELQFDYPETWTRSLKRGILDDEGTIKTRTYIPIPIPSGSPATAPKITTGNSTQSDVSPKIKNLPSAVTATVPKTASQPNNSTKNPPKKDSGITPPVVLPTGKASSMWAVYNPSQSEMNSFGAWMWSSDLLEQIRKVFTDPMQAVIGVHKVFCGVNVGGRKNIKIGYLDTGISTNYVSDQYSEVNCGHVYIDEYFGNVMDYAPYTSINLYLPFVGVVPLSVADVMRSSINVTYGIDVYTGDCLAKVNVKRDNAGGILYSYPGNCAVKYPISSGSYLSILGFVAGIVGSVATGNPGMLVSPRGIPTVQHGGSFVGNSGATGPKKPYLIISRPQSELALNFNSFEGYPVNTTQKIGDCRGFIRVKEVHINGINATDDELDMIDQILKDGIIVQS